MEFHGWASSGGSSGAPRRSMVRDPVPTLGISNSSQVLFCPMDFVHSRHVNDDARRLAPSPTPAGTSGASR
eukprot:5154755-Pyramimonas_sp.AAC.1